MFRFPLRSRADVSRLCRLVFLVLVLAGSSDALGQTVEESGFILSDPTSEIYYHQALASGVEIRLDNGVSVTGAVHSNGDVDLGRDAVVTGDVAAGGVVRSRGTIDGTVTEAAEPLVLPEIDEAAMRQRADRVLDGDVTFQDERIDDVVFVDGTVRIRGDVHGVGTIFATGDIRLDTVGPPRPFELEDATRLSLIALRTVRIGKDRPLRGVVRAGRDIQVEGAVRFEGVLVADRHIHVNKDAVVELLDFDTVAPDIELLAPEAGAFVTTALPTIRLAASDDFSGVRTDGFTVRLDGEEVDAEVTGTADGLDATFTPTESLSEGPHEIEATVADHSDNEAMETFSFAVDTLPPELAIAEPADGAVLQDRLPTLEITFSDAGSGIDEAALRVTLDGTDVTSGCVITADGASCPTVEELLDGSHTVSAEIRDLTGHLAAASSSFDILADEVAPVVAFTRVEEPLEGETTAVLEIEYSDADSGIDADSFAFSVDGLDRTAACGVGPASARCETTLTEGFHGFKAAIRDRAGNPDFDLATLTVVLEPPQITLTEPADGTLTNEPSIEVTGTVTDDGEVARVVVLGLEAEITGSTFTLDLPLGSLGNRIEAIAIDGAGNRAVSETVEVTYDDEAPEIELLTPLPGRLTNRAEMLFEGFVSDLLGLEEMTVAGTVVPVDDESRFRHAVPLPEGESTVLLTARDTAGNVRELEVPVERRTLPRVTLTAPANGAVFGTDGVTVAGTVGETVTEVTVNGLPATLTGDRFELAGVPLAPGVNILTAEASTAAGLTTRALVTVYRDARPPRVEIVTPGPAQTVTESRIDVRGLVNDLTAAVEGQAMPTVTVNGVPARVSGQSFLATGVDLAPGVNTLTAVATDAAGNTATDGLNVTFEPLAGARVVEVSGNGQEAVIGRTLPEPLVVRLKDAEGQPVPNRPVLFEVVRNDGVLEGGERIVAVPTDASGLARVGYTLGTRVGQGLQQVDAYAAGFAGRVSFFSSALPGTPAELHMDTGDQQVWVAGDVLPLPLVASVTDEGFNRLEGVPILFEVVEGNGSFAANGDRELTLVSDSLGRAAASFRLDEEEGRSNNIVRARVDTPTGPLFTSFVASGLAAGEPAETAIRGVVLDNTDQPVPGVTLHVTGTNLSTQADEAGVFRLEGVPPGHVRLEADGATATRPGKWPHLEFEMSIVPGRDNTLGRPIYMLPLDTERGLVVSETKGGVLTLPELPGFALEVEPGSVTFPDGSRTGVVSVTLVHGDKVPMAPSFGQQPRFVITIQPSGAAFDPPARLSFPNVDGLAPGQSTEMYSFDHDLAAFVAIGTGTVTDDGTTLVSDPGVGVLKAGWHCGGNPATGGTPHDCPECKECDPSSGNCIPTTGSCDDKMFCTSADGKSPGTDVCENGACKGKKIEDRVLGTGLDYGLPPTLTDNLDRIARVVSLVPGCELEDEDLGLDLNVSATEIDTCCEKEKKTTIASKLSGGIGISLTAECNIPGLSLPTKTVEVGVQGTVGVGGNFELSGEDNGCEGCSWELGGSVGVTPALGVEVELPFDIIEANLDAEYGGQLAGTFKCGEGDLFGCLGPLAIVGTINFVDVVSESVRFEVPGTEFCKGKEE